jgi:hypothetical protein
MSVFCTYLRDKEILYKKLVTHWFNRLACNERLNYLSAWNIQHMHSFSKSKKMELSCRKKGRQWLKKKYLPQTYLVTKNQNFKNSSATKMFLTKMRFTSMFMYTVHGFVCAYVHE